MDSELYPFKIVLVYFSWTLISICPSSDSHTLSNFDLSSSYWLQCIILGFPCPVKESLPQFSKWGPKNDAM